MNWLDYTIIIVYTLGFLSLGYIFKDNKDSKDYFLGGRSLGWFPLSLSTMATQLSAISFISAPAFVGMKQNGGMQWLTFEFGVPLAMIFVLLVIIPNLYKSGVVSVYEYLEKRFNSTSRLMISVVFQLSRSFGTGVMVYAMALILQAVIGIDFKISIIVIGVITLIYSFQGGMRAVIWGDVIQMMILFCGIIIILLFGLHELGGWSSFIENVDQSRLLAVDFSKMGINNINGSDEFGFWPMLIGGFFLYVSYYGTDQTQTQRMLSAKNMTTIKRLVTVNGLFRFPVTLTYSVMGLVLGALLIKDSSFGQMISDTFTAHSDSLKSETDLLVPVFIIKYLPNGIIGILLIAILSAAMSSLSSTVNSLSAVTVEDFIKRFKPDMGDKQYVMYSRLTSIFWGLVCLLSAFFAGNIADTVIEAINKIGSVFYGPILAAFLLAIMTKRTHALGLNIGIVTGVLFNVYLWKFVPEIFWFWWNAIGAAITIITAYGLSILIKKDQPKEHYKPFYYFAPREMGILLLFFAFMVMLSILLPQFF